jgi:hypothetical protein
VVSGVEASVFSPVVADGAVGRITNPPERQPPSKVTASKTVKIPAVTRIFSITSPVFASIVQAFLRLVNL